MAKFKHLETGFVKIFYIGLLANNTAVHLPHDRKEQDEPFGRNIINLQHS
jgi:hypothetical protein